MAEPVGRDQETERVDRIEASLARILRLQGLGFTSEGEVEGCKSTQSNGCNFSSLSTGGCAIGALSATPQE